MYWLTHKCFCLLYAYVQCNTLIISFLDFWRKEAWSRIQNNTRDSTFVKELSVALWATQALGKRSHTGRECPNTKTTRQPLSPRKLCMLKGMTSLAAIVTWTLWDVKYWDCYGVFYVSLFCCDRSITVYLCISFQSASRISLRHFNLTRIS